MLANWISETTATTGAGTISLGGAASADLRTMSSAYASGDAVPYQIKDGNNRESGIGLLTSGTPWTLARTTIHEKWEGGTYTENPATGIDLSGSATVSVDASSDGLDFSKSFTASLNDGPDNFGPITSPGVAMASADTMTLLPMFLLAKRKFNTIIFNVNVADAGTANLRFGIYKTAPNGGVGNLVFDSGDQSASAGTTGAKSASLGQDVTLPAGHYWMAVATSSTTLRLLGCPVYDIRGGFGGLANGGDRTIPYVTGVSGALPTTDPTIAGNLTTARAAFMWRYT